MASRTSHVLALVLSLCFSSLLTAQHCPPIVESYLSATSIDRSDAGLCFSFTYSKTGGRPKASYQAYLLALPTGDAERIAKMTPQEAIAGKHAEIIGTQIINRDKEGKYKFKFETETETFVKTLLDAGMLNETKTSDAGGWKSFDDHVQLAVFIPFLDDEKYSVLDKLPDDTHECNYRGASALLFERLSHNLQVCFGVVQAVKLEDGKHYIQLNGSRVARAHAR